MGWAYCGPDEDGRPMGYAVQAVCDEPGCNEWIDRGLGHLCGEMHCDGLRCNKYYCPEHHAAVNCCSRCLDPED